MDDYIIGAMILYIDIIMLFLEILKLLSKVMGKNWFIDKKKIYISIFYRLFYKNIYDFCFFWKSKF